MEIKTSKACASPNNWKYTFFHQTSPRPLADTVQTGSPGCSERNNKGRKKTEYKTGDRAGCAACSLGKFCEKPEISVLIPNRNGSATISRCLEAIYRSVTSVSFEVIVVDDASTDDSLNLLRRYPVRIIRFPNHKGTSAARNAAARTARAEILFFIDADCMIRPDTLSRVLRSVRNHGDGTIVGGTYAKVPHDPGPFNTFQALFVHYHETRRADRPDYIAGHAMAMNRKTIERIGEFQEDFLPILEDVEFTHRARRHGAVLRMEPAVQVYHRFGFNLRRSLRNAFRKTFWWVVYSTGRGDIGADSGTASHELKANVLAMTVGSTLLIPVLSAEHPIMSATAGLVLLANLWFNRRFLAFLFRHAPGTQKLSLPVYYLSLFAIAVGMGTLAGLFEVLRRRFFGWNRKGPVFRRPVVPWLRRRRWAATGAASLFLQIVRQLLHRA